MISQLTSKRFPGFRSLYELADPGSDHEFVASIDIPAESALSFLRDEMGGDKTVVGHWAMGRATPQDIVWTTLALPVLVSEQVVRIFREKNFTGWTVSPCNLFDKSKRTWRYYLLRVHGRCGPIIDSQSEKIQKIYPGGVFPFWKGLYFDPASWNGADVFMPDRNVGWIFVTKPVKQALEEADIKSALFTALDQVERAQLSE